MAKERVKTLDALLEQEYNVSTHPGNQSGVKVVGTSVSQLVSANPNRVSLTVMNIGSVSVWLDIENTVSSTTGLLLSPNGGVMSLNWRDDMSMIPREWFVIAAGIGTNVKVFEVVTE